MYDVERRFEKAGAKMAKYAEKHRLATLRHERLQNCLQERPAEQAAPPVAEEAAPPVAEEAAPPAAGPGTASTGEAVTALKPGLRGDVGAATTFVATHGMASKVLDAKGYLQVPNAFELAEDYIDSLRTIR